MYFVGCFYIRVNSRAVASAAKRQKTKQSDLLSFRPGLNSFFLILKKIHEDLIQEMFVLSRCHRLLNAPSSSTTHTHSLRELWERLLWGMMLVFCRHGMLRCSWTEVRAGNDLRVSTDRCQRTLRLPLLAPRGPKPYLHTRKHSEGPSDANTLTYTNTRGFLSFTCPLVERDLNTVCFLVYNKVKYQVIMTYNCLGFILKLKRFLIECKIVLPVCWSVIAQKTQWSCLPYLRCYC